MGVFVLPVVILLPFASWLVDRAGELGDLSPSLAFLTVIGLLLLDAVAIIPHGLVGALAATAMPWTAAWIATWLGQMGAAMIMYGLGRYAGRPLAGRIIGKSDMEAAETRAGTVSALLLFGTRPVPVVGEVILIAAGIAHYPFRRFLMAVGAANAVLALGYTGLGQMFGSVDTSTIVLVATVGIPAAAAILYCLVTLLRPGREQV
ncbi:hypothetical protein GCM10022213_27030 [Parerythrobacter jejuensis]